MPVDLPLVWGNYDVQILLKSLMKIENIVENRKLCVSSVEVNFYPFFLQIKN